MFNYCVKVILEYEGGFVNHPDDPGAATNMGITTKTLSRWLRRPATEDDIRNLNVGTAKVIYQEYYWNPIDGHNLPPGVNLVVFDMAVNAGVTRAIKMLQECVGVTVDGIIGPNTLAAVTNHGWGSLIDRYSDLRLEVRSGSQTYVVNVSEARR